jgi:nucleoside-diphosphate-sugar epimerase
VHVLVTGGAGFIGSSLTRSLLQDTANNVRILDNLHRGKNAFEGTPRAEFVHGDIRSREAVRAAMKDVDVVYHLAAQSSVLGAEGDLDYSFTSNVVGTFEILSAALECRVQRVIFTSSREVYGEVADLPVPESAPVRPKNGYGASKATGELYCRVFAEQGLDIAVLRLANVYGPGDAGRVIPLFLENAVKGRSLVIYGDNKILDFVWIGDVVNALKKAQAAPVAGQTINIGSGEGTTLQVLAEKMRALTNSTSPIQFTAPRTIEIDRYVADIRLAKRLLDFHPSTALEHLPEVIEVFKR